MYSNEYTLTSINNSLRFFKQKSLVDSKIIRNFAVEIKTIKNMTEKEMINKIYDFVDDALTRNNMSEETYNYLNIIRNMIEVEGLDA